MKAKLLPIILCLFALSAFAQTKEARKFDELEVYNCEDLKVRVFNFIAGIKNETGSKGYIVIYEGKYKAFSYDKNGNSTSKFVLPRIGEANSRLQLIKQHFEFLGYSSKNIVFLNGGFRENLITEFWLVPEDAEQPKLTPTLKKIKHRKGKIPKLQMGDC